MLPIPLRTDPVEHASWDDFQDFCIEARKAWRVDGTLSSDQFSVLDALAASGRRDEHNILLTRLRGCGYVRKDDNTDGYNTSDFDVFKTLVLKALTQTMHFNIHFNVRNPNLVALPLEQLDRWRNALDLHQTLSVNVYHHKNGHGGHHAQKRVLRRRPGIELDCFGYQRNVAPHLRPKYGALNLAGSKYGNCCAFEAYGRGFLGLHHNMLPRITFAECDTGNRPRIFTAENFLDLVSLFTAREIHLLVRFLIVTGLVEGDNGRAERWTDICRAGLETADVCDYEANSESDDGDSRNDDLPRLGIKRCYRELAVHGELYLKDPRQVAYVHTEETDRKSISVFRELFVSRVACLLP